MNNIAAASRRCVKCDRNYPLHGTVCTPCKSPPEYYQDQDQDQVKPGKLLSFKKSSSLVLVVTPTLRRTRVPWQ